MKKNAYSLVEEIPEEYKEYVTLNDKARVLARHYVEAGVVKKLVLFQDRLKS